MNLQFAAFAEVQQTSVSAFTSAEVFTYETTGTPGFCFFLTSSPVIDDDKQPAHIWPTLLLELP